MFSLVSGTNGVVDGAIMLQGSVSGYVNGELDEVELAMEIAGAYIKRYVRTMAVESLKTMNANVIAVAVAAVAVTEVCDFTIDVLKDWHRTVKLCKEEIRAFNKVANEAVDGIIGEKEKLIRSVEDFFGEFDEQSMLAFERMYESVNNNDADGLADGLNELLALYGQEVKFKTEEDFDEFWESDDVLKL